MFKTIPITKLETVKIAVFGNIFVEAQIHAVERGESKEKKMAQLLVPSLCIKSFLTYDYKIAACNTCYNKSKTIYFLPKLSLVVEKLIMY